MTTTATQMYYRPATIPYHAALAALEDHGMVPAIMRDGLVLLDHVAAPVFLPIDDAGRVMARDVRTLCGY